MFTQKSSTKDTVYAGTIYFTQIITSIEYTFKPNPTIILAYFNSVRMIRLTGYRIYAKIRRL